MGAEGKSCTCDQNQLDPSFCGSLAFGLSSAEDVGEEEGPKT